MIWGIRLTELVPGIISDVPTPAPDRVPQLLAAAADHESAGRLDQAEAVLREVLREQPNNSSAIHQLGIVAFKRDQIEEAAELIEQAIALAPSSALYYRNLCEVYRVLSRLDEALVVGRQAATLAPSDPLCQHNLSILHYHRLELDDAIAAAERALLLLPDFPGAHFGIAEAALLKGDFGRGWEEYEWRFKLGNVSPLMPPSARPQWDGRPVGDGRLLLIADQGYGDVIQFARYIQWAASISPWPAIACSRELQPIIAQQLGVGLIFDHWENAPEFDAYCPLSGLPRLAGTDLDSIPAPIPYVRAEEKRFAYWAERLWTWLPSSYRRIGIVWAGRSSHHNDRNRSIRLAEFAPLLRLPQMAFLSLQKGAAQAEIGSCWGTAPVFNVGPELGDYGDTMAVLECLERVITVDTSVAHLAGAMGKEVFLMLPYAPDWRWLLGRNDSPWYPTVRLFRQDKDRLWGPVIERIIQALC